MKKIIVKIATAVIVLGLVGGIIYWKSLPEEDVSIETVYTEEYQNDVADKLESKKSLNDYDEDHMLIEYNPFKLILYHSMFILILKKLQKYLIL